MTDLEKLKADLELANKDLALLRDKFREIELNAGMQAENAEEAMNNIEYAVDALSRLV